MNQFISEWTSKFTKKILDNKTSSSAQSKDWLTPQETFKKSKSVYQENKTYEPMQEKVLGPWKGTVSEKTITDKSFQLDLPLSQQLIQATGIDPRTLKIDWDKPGDALEPELPILKLRRITDASGDGSLAEVFEDGALRVNFSSDGWPPYINEIHVSDRVQRVDVDTNVNASVIAKDLDTGEVIELGTQRVDPNQGSFLVNLKDKLNAVSMLSLRDNYAIEVNFSGGQDNRPLESFSEVITLIKPMQYGNNHLGDETSDLFNYSDVGSAIGSARVFKGRGGTDFLNLEGIRSTDVLSFNGRSGINAATASDLGQQAFYGGTVFDTLSLNNGDELYLQGIERLRFSDVTIDLTPNLDTTSNNQWNTQVMDVSGAWRFNTGSDQVVLVSLDSGIAESTGSHDEIDHISLNTNQNTAGSQHGHRAMSLMTAEHDGNDVAGVAPDNPVWAYTIGEARNGVSIFDAIADAKAERTGQRLVFQNGSGSGWGDWGDTEQAMRQALSETAEYGFFSASAGNDGDNTGVAGGGGIAPFQTDFGNVASVGALESGAREVIDELTNATAVQLASYSNSGEDLTLVAPTDSRAIDGNGNVLNFDGTSAANPNLAGVAALVWSENLNINGGELREILTSSAMDLGAGGFDNTFGFGLVNAESAIRRTHALDQNQELASFWANNEFMA